METPASLLSFATLLKRYRREAGLTQEALAERAGYSSAYLSKLEQGARRPLALTVEVLAEVLQLAPPERTALEAAARRPLTTHAHPRLRGRPPFVGPNLLSLAGRVQERTRLGRHIAGEGPPLLVLMGEPGFGKTRLLQEGTIIGQQQGLSILTGGCHRRSGQEPYTLFGTALAQTLAQKSPNEQRLLLAGCGGLVHLLPELAEAQLLSSPTWTLPPAQERRLMFAAVGQFLENVSGSAGTLLVLDDLQWADADTLDLLASLVRSPTASPLRVVGAYRQTEVRGADALSLLLTDLTREGVAQQIELGPLSPEEATTLLNSLLESMGEDQRAIAVQRVLMRASGVPYFLVSCAQGLRAGAEEALGSIQEKDIIPQNVAESIRQRVALLPETAQYLLGVAAVAERQIQRSLLLTLAAPLEWSQREVLVALESTCRARLLVEQGEEQYAFAHDLIREVVLADLSAARRAILHQQVAEALEHEPGEPPVERLAHHYRRSGLLEKAVVYLEHAGDRANAMYAHAKAEQSYRELVQALTRLERRTQVAAAQEKLAGVVATSARYSEALSVLEEALVVYQTAQDVECQARVIAKMGQLHASRGTSADGITLLEPWLASNQAGTLSAKSRGMLSLTLVYLFLNSGRYTEALAAAQQAADLAQQAQDIHLLGKANWHAGRSLMLLGRAEKAIPLFEAALPIAEQAGDLRDLYYILVNLSLVWESRGDLSVSRQYAERAMAFAERMGDPFLLAQMLSTHAFNQFVLGEWQGSRQEYERAIRLMRQASRPWGASYPLLGFGLQLLAEGQVERGLAALEEGLSLAQRDQDRKAEFSAQSILAVHNILLGCPEQARNRLEPLIDGASLEEPCVISSLPFLAWAHLELGNVAQAQSLVEQAQALARDRQMMLALTDAFSVRARVAAHRQGWQEAEQALEEMRTLAQSIPCPYDEAKAHYAAGLVAVQQGKTTQAHTHLNEALVILHRLGERCYTEKVEQALAALVLTKAPP